MASGKMGVEGIAAGGQGQLDGIGMPNLSKIQVDS